MIEYVAFRKEMAPTQRTETRTGGLRGNKICLVLRQENIGVVLKKGLNIYLGQDQGKEGKEKGKKKKRPSRLRPGVVGLWWISCWHQFRRLSYYWVG